MVYILLLSQAISFTQYLGDKICFNILENQGKYIYSVGKCLFLKIKLQVQLLKWIQITEAECKREKLWQQMHNKGKTRACTWALDGNKRRLCHMFWTTFETLTEMYVKENQQQLCMEIGQ